MAPEAVSSHHIDSKTIDEIKPRDFSRDLKQRYRAKYDIIFTIYQTLIYSLYRNIKRQYLAESHQIV